VGRGAVVEQFALNSFAMDLNKCSVGPGSRSNQILRFCTHNFFESELNIDF